MRQNLTCVIWYSMNFLSSVWVILVSFIMMMDCIQNVEITEEQVTGSSVLQYIPWGLTLSNSKTLKAAKSMFSKNNSHTVIGPIFHGWVLFLWLWARWKMQCLHSQLPCDSICHILQNSRVSTSKIQIIS